MYKIEINTIVIILLSMTIVILKKIMTLWDYIEPFVIYNYCKNEYRVPNEITHYIYSFIIEDIKEKIIKSFLENEVNKFFIDKKLWYDKKFRINLNNVPYLKLNNHKRIKTKNVILDLLNKNSKKKYVFNYYCCNGNGIVFDIEENYYHLRFI